MGETELTRGSSSETLGCSGFELLQSLSQDRVEPSWSRTANKFSFIVQYTCRNVFRVVVLGQGY